MLRRIRDERIVQVYDIGTLPDGRPYFVMDYCNGGSLEYLRKHPTEPGRALRLCAEAARALEVLHRHQIIHRDVTPGNILLSQDLTGDVRVQVADLGVAKSMIDRVGATMTAGTPAYMALEQANGGDLDARADIYSLGAVAYALLTGRPPFPVKTLNDLLARNHAIGPAPIADQVGAGPALDELLAATLSPDPGRRPPTAEILADALDRLADGLPGADSYVPRPLPGDGSLLRPSAPTAYDVAVPSPMAPNSAGSLAPSSYRTGSGIADPMETPATMLTHYIPEAGYAVTQERERHSALFWIWLAVTAVGLFIVFLLAGMYLSG